MIPKEITIDIDSGIQTASFSYNEGISYAQTKGLKQSVYFRDVRKGTHFIVCCGDVMVKVESQDYPNIIRREF